LANYQFKQKVDIPYRNCVVKSVIGNGSLRPHSVHVHQTQIGHISVMGSIEEQDFRAFKRFRDNVAADKCPICCDAKPNIITVCCGKGVCIKCMTKWLGKKESCPQCRAHIPFRPTSDPVDFLSPNIFSSTSLLRSWITRRESLRYIEPEVNAHIEPAVSTTRSIPLVSNTISSSSDNTSPSLPSTNELQSRVTAHRGGEHIASHSASFRYFLNRPLLPSNIASSSLDITSPSLTSTNELQSRATAHREIMLSSNDIFASSSLDNTSPSLTSNNELQSRGKIIVFGAGLKTVNGIYNYNGVFDTVAMYSKIGMWEKRKVTFSLFRCSMNDNTKSWYISIVPKNMQPGTYRVTDFYVATATGDESELPDSVLWMTANEGAEPAPTAALSSAPYEMQTRATAHTSPAVSISRRNTRRNPLPSTAHRISYQPRRTISNNQQIRHRRGAQRKGKR